MKMPREYTICHDCDNVYPDSRKSAPWRWLCVKHPRMEGFGFVTNEAWDNMPPYLYCRDLNGGACPLFVKRKPQEK